jgi:hypothetical protein
MVAHSIGGLIAAKAILASPTIGDRLDGLLMISVPLSGFRPAGLIGFLSPWVRGLTIGAGHIEEIRRTWLKRFGDHPPFAIKTVFGEKESLVRIEHLPGSSLTFIPDATHSSVLRSDVELAEIIRAMIADRPRYSSNGRPSDTRP